MGINACCVYPLCKKSLKNNYASDRVPGAAVHVIQAWDNFTHISRVINLATVSQLLQIAWRARASRGRGPMYTCSDEFAPVAPGLEELESPAHLAAICILFFSLSLSHSASGFTWAALYARRYNQFIIWGHRQRLCANICIAKLLAAGEDLLEKKVGRRAFSWKRRDTSLLDVLHVHICASPA